jgi:methyl-accepting chemotaxis protein
VDKKIIKPVRKISKAAKEIAKGDVNVSFDIECKGELLDLKESFIEITDRVKEQALATQMISSGNFDIEFRAASSNDVFSSGLITMKNTIDDILNQVEIMIKEILNGNLTVRGDEEAYQGKWKSLILDINSLVDSLVAPINMTADYVEKISQGNIPPKITDIYLGNFNNIKNYINECIDVMNGLIDETTRLTKAILEGKLDQLGNYGEFNGSWGNLIEGINHLIEAFVTPINIMSENIELIGKGEIPQIITDTYYGDFNKIKASINSCIAGLGGLVEGSETLKKISVNDYTDRVKGEYLGIYSDIADSINLVNERINKVLGILEHISCGDLSDMDQIKEEGQQSKNDQLVPCLIIMIETIKALYVETDDLWRAAMDGRLDFRGDQKKFKGYFEEIIEGINETMDAVTTPIKEAHNVLMEIAKGNLHAAMEGDYKGDHAELKVALNETRESLLNYIGEISSTLSEIGNGNLNLEITAEYKGDFIEIQNSLNGILESLNGVLGNINKASQEVSAGSSQVSLGSQSLSQGSTEQASTIQELNASIAELAGQTKQNAVHANDASKLAEAAKENALKGNDQMKEMLDSMTEINEASSNISRIIKVIDDIAFQTNILALNAAVEAARAGQHGKGFAVVAEEVRNLAARSAKAANETSELIEGSIDKVHAGMVIANNTAGALNEIVTGIEKSAELVKNIAIASNEQATGIAQINKGLEQVSLVVQNNSATAEESAASSEELSGQAEILKVMISKFVLRKGSEVKLLGSLETEDTLVGYNPRIALNEEIADKY